MSASHRTGTDAGERMIASDRLADSVNSPRVEAQDGRTSGRRENAESATELR